MTGTQKGPVQQRRHPVITYLKSPKPIHVKVEDFQTLVQRLTGGSRKRKAAIAPAPEEAEVPEVSSSGSESIESDGVQEPLDKVEAESPPIKGMFPTAGLVKAAKCSQEHSVVEDSLDFPQEPLISGLDLSFAASKVTDYKLSALDLSYAAAIVSDDKDAEGDYSHLYSPLGSLSTLESLSFEWMEGPGCQSPSTYQVTKFAKRTAASVHGSGPHWRINWQDGSNAWNDGADWDMGLDHLLSSGDIPLAGFGSG